MRRQARGCGCFRLILFPSAAAFCAHHKQPDHRNFRANPRKLFCRSTVKLLVLVLEICAPVKRNPSRPQYNLAT